MNRITHRLVNYKINNFTKESQLRRMSESSSTPPPVQYVVVREDLAKKMEWSAGSVIAQACHCSVAALWEHKEEPLTAGYLSSQNIDSMHKVILKCKNENELLKLEAQLKQANVPHRLWMEKPENIPTALATAAVIKSDVSQFFRKAQLYREMSVLKKEEPKS